MEKKTIFLLVLVMAIVLPLAFISCDEPKDDEDIWTEITDVSQLNGKWTGTYSANQSGGGASISLNSNIDFTFNAGKLSGTQITTYRFSGTNAQAAYSSAKEDLEEEEYDSETFKGVITTNDSDRSITLSATYINAAIVIESINYDSSGNYDSVLFYFESIEINHDWKKIRFPIAIGGYAILNKK